MMMMMMMMIHAGYSEVQISDTGTFENARKCNANTEP